MSTKLPTKCETKCSGISHMMCQLLFVITSVLYFPVYRAYSVSKEKDVIELHNMLSQPSHIAQLQAVCVIYWINFPLALISIYGFKSILLPIVQGTSAKLMVYVLEKAYILYSLYFILVPAVTLSLISYDWTFDESGVVPAGYYVQLCLTVLQLEIADCLFLANGTFIVLIFILMRFIIWKASDPQNVTYQQIYNLLRPRCIAILPCCTSRSLTIGRECVFIGTPIAAFIVVVAILCDFAPGGLFSFDSFFKYSIIFVFGINFCLGAGLVWLSNGDKLRMLDKILTEKQTELFFETTTPQVNINELQVQTRSSRKQVPNSPYTPLQGKTGNDGFPNT